MRCVEEQEDGAQPQADASAQETTHSRRWSTVVWGAIPVAALAVMMSINHVPGTNISLAVPYAAEGPGPMLSLIHI